MALAVWLRSSADGWPRREQDGACREELLVNKPASLFRGSVDDAILDAPPSQRPETLGTLGTLESDIREIRRPVDVSPMPAMPYAGWPATCDLLAKMAHAHATAGEQALARRACEDAMLMIEQLTASRTSRDHELAANAAEAVGEAFMLLSEAHRAKDCFEIAAHHFDDTGNVARAAKARVGLAKALLALHDPSGRAVLEDAGEMFEELGDERNAIAIDLALRQADADFEASPRSFHSSSHMRVAKRVG